MEVSALKHAGVAGIHGRSPLLRLQSDERLIALVRRGNHGAFEVLVGRYQARLLAFCRHMLASREDAEDVLQEVFAAAFNAILADDRPINVRPWLYRIARNRSLNHLRRQQPIGVDSMDIHLSENGLTTADKASRREDFRLLLEDVKGLPETQRTALLLRELDALSYEQISEAMETTVPSVKSLLVRARVSLAEAAEARELSCDYVRNELGAVAEGLKKMPSPVRRHVRGCDRCATFRKQLKRTNKTLALALPVAPLLLVKKLVLAQLGGHVSASSGATAAAGAGAAAAGGGIAASSLGSGLLSAGVGALATKAAAGLAAAAIVAAGAAEVKHVTTPPEPATHEQASAAKPVAPAHKPSPPQLAAAGPQRQLHAPPPAAGAPAQPAAAKDSPHKSKAKSKDKSDHDGKTAGSDSGTDSSAATTAPTTTTTTPTTAAPPKTTAAPDKDAKTLTTPAATTPSTGSPPPTQVGSLTTGIPTGTPKPTGTPPPPATTEPVPTTTTPAPPATTPTVTTPPATTPTATTPITTTAPTEPTGGAPAP